MIFDWIFGCSGERASGYDEDGEYHPEDDWETYGEKRACNVKVDDTDPTSNDSPASDCWDNITNIDL